MVKPRLRIVPPRRVYRPSVIVDMSRYPAQPMTPPLTLREAEAMQARGMPNSVFCAMWVASWARAEHCPLTLTAGRLEPYCKYNPSEGLWAAVGQQMGNIIGSLGFAIPIMLDERKRPRAASWPFTWETN
jgi:hypothetical protein